MPGNNIDLSKYGYNSVSDLANAIKNSSAAKFTNKENTRQESIFGDGGGLGAGATKENFVNRMSELGFDDENIANGSWDLFNYNNDGDSVDVIDDEEYELALKKYGSDFDGKHDDGVYSKVTVASLQGHLGNPRKVVENTSDSAESTDDNPNKNAEVSDEENAALDATNQSNDTGDTTETKTDEADKTQETNEIEKTQGTDKTKKTSSASSIDELFAKNQKVQKDENGQYHITTDKWSENSPSDNLDCTSRIIKNVYGVDYDSEQGNQILEQLKQENQEFFKNGIDVIPANARLNLIDATEILGLGAEENPEEATETADKSENENDEQNVIKEQAEQAMASAMGKLAEARASGDDESAEKIAQDLETMTNAYQAMGFDEEADEIETQSQDGDEEVLADDGSGIDPQMRKDMETARQRRRDIESGKISPSQENSGEALPVQNTNPSATGSVSDNSADDGSISENSISGNSVSENSVSNNNVSSNSVGGNSTSENSISNNSVSNNAVNENDSTQDTSKSAQSINPRTAAQTEQEVINSIADSYKNNKKEFAQYQKDWAKAIEKFTQSKNSFTPTLNDDKTITFSMALSEPTEYGTYKAVEITMDEKGKDIIKGTIAEKYANGVMNAATGEDLSGRFVKIVDVDIDKSGVTFSTVNGITENGRSYDKSAKFKDNSEAFEYGWDTNGDGIIDDKDLKTKKTRWGRMYLDVNKDGKANNWLAAGNKDTTNGKDIRLD